MEYHRDSIQEEMRVFACRVLVTLEKVSVLFIAMIFIETVVAYFRPINHWVEYVSVIPITNVFEFDEPLTFTSERNVYKPSRVAWEDTLVCDNHYVGTYLSSQYVHSDTQTWTMHIVPPITGGKQCYVETSYTIKPDTVLGLVEKTGHIDSTTFSILPDPDWDLMGVEDEH